MNPHTLAAYTLIEQAYKLALTGLQATSVSDTQALPYAQAYYAFCKEAWDKVRNYESPEDKFANEMFDEEMQRERALDDAIIDANR